MMGIERYRNVNCCKCWREWVWMSLGGQKPNRSFAVATPLDLAVRCPVRASVVRVLAFQAGQGDQWPCQLRRIAIFKCTYTVRQNQVLNFDLPFSVTSYRFQELEVVASKNPENLDRGVKRTCVFDSSSPFHPWTLLLRNLYLKSIFNMSFESPFTIKEYIIPCAHIREDLTTTSNFQESWRMSVKQYTPISNSKPREGDVTIIGSHGNGFLKVYMKILSHVVFYQRKLDLKMSHFCFLGNIGATAFQT